MENPRQGVPSWLILLGSFALAIVMVWLLRRGDVVTREAAFMAGIFVLAAMLWVTEALPLFATSLLVIGLQAVLLANPGGWPGLGFASGVSRAAALSCASGVLSNESDGEPGFDTMEQSSGEGFKCALATAHRYGCTGESEAGKNFSTRSSSRLEEVQTQLAVIPTGFSPAFVVAGVSGSSKMGNSHIFNRRF
jgi:hypothetical protein